MQIVSGWVLAGGRSTRMGTDKALLEYEGKPLWGHAAETLGAICSTVAIVGGEVSTNDFTVYPDTFQCGPLGGIVTALQSTQTDWSVFLPVDMPLVPVSWMLGLVARLDTAHGMAVITRCDGLPQPLVAAFHRNLLHKLEQSVLHQIYKVIQAVSSATEVVYLDTSEHELFRNVNTPEEFANLQPTPKVLG